MSTPDLQQGAAPWARLYARRVAELRCTQCGMRLFGETTKKCEDCNAYNRKKRRLKKNRRADAKRARAKYWANPEPKRAAVRDEKLRKKLDGECHDCTEPALDGSARCRTCLDHAAANERVRYHARKAA